MNIVYHRASGVFPPLTTHYKRRRSDLDCTIVTLRSIRIVSGQMRRKHWSMSLFSELKRRNVPRMAALYLVSAWLIMQVTEVLLSLAELPAATGPLVLLLLTIGFPIALLLSWFYELTPAGLRLEESAGTGGSTPIIQGRQVDLIIIALLCAALTVFTYDKWGLGAAPITSVAVLPLESLSGDPEQDYFAEQMTGVLITELTKIDGLTVQSRRTAERYRGSDKSLPEIARELGVDAIIEGSTQWAGDKVHLNLQLVDASSDRNLWADRFVRDVADIFELQREVARTVADQAHIELTSVAEARLSAGQPVVPDALRYWLIGNHHLKSLNVESFGKARRAFRRAIEIDPTFANAYAGLAHVYAYQGGWHGDEPARAVIQNARAAARKAIELDPDLAEARLALAQVHVLEWDWEAAKREYESGIDLNPSDATGLIEYANFLSAIGRHEDSVEVAMQAVQIDPLSPASHNELGGALWISGHHAAALAKYEEALQLDPDFFQTQWIIADLRIEAGEYDKAMPFLNSLRQDYEALAPGMIGLVGRLHAVVGREDVALDMLDYLLDRTEIEYIPATAIALIYLGLGDEEQSIAWLERAHEQRDVWLIWLREAPEFASLYGDPRFQDLLGRLPYPDKTISDQHQKS